MDDVCYADMCLPRTWVDHFLGIVFIQNEIIENLTSVNSRRGYVVETP